MAVENFIIILIYAADFCDTNPHVQQSPVSPRPLCTAINAEANHG